MLLEDVPEFGEGMLGTWEKFHEYGTVPRGWQVAEGAQLSKANGKRGCAAVRLINVLDPGGKVFFKELWAGASPPRLDCAYGFYKGRRREQLRLSWSYIRYGGSCGSWEWDMSRRFTMLQMRSRHFIIGLWTRWWRRVRNGRMWTC